MLHCIIDSHQLIISISQSLNMSMASNTVILERMNLRTATMYDMVHQIYTMMPKIIGYPWERGYGLDERPLRLLDALGRDLQIPVIFLSSVEIFHDTLEILHRDLPGHRKIISKEYRVVDEDANGQAVDMANGHEWRRAASGGKTISLSMEFRTHLYNKETQSCPKCKAFTNESALGGQRRCQRCLLTFSILEQVRVGEDEKRTHPLKDQKPQRSPRNKKGHSATSKRRRKSRTGKQESDERYGFKRIHFIYEIIERKSPPAPAEQEGSIWPENQDRYMQNLPPLHDAAAVGDLKSVKNILDAKEADVDCPGGIRGGTALHYAALQGHQAIAIYLIQRGAQVDAQDSEGLTALHNCTIYGHTSMLRLLVESGAPVDARCVLGRTPLYYSVDQRQYSIAALLIDEGANVNATDHFGKKPLHLIRGDCSDLITLLIGEGADIHAQDEDAVTAMHYAASNCSVTAVQTLLELGASANAMTKANWNPLVYALSRNREKDVWSICDLLLRYGAQVRTKPDLQGNEEVSLIHTAMSHGFLSVIQLLVSYGAPLEDRNEHKKTGLLVAIERNQYKIFNCLISIGANVNTADDEGNTPLHYAAGSQDSRLVSELLDAGATVAFNNRNQNPLHFVAEATQSVTIRHLIDAGADVNWKDQEGATPLHTAARMGSPSAVAALIEAGADVHAYDHHAWQPIHVAAAAAGTKSCEVLLDHGVDVNAPIVCNADESNASSPLHLAALSGCSKTTALLLKRGANVLAADSNGDLPIHLAVRGRYRPETVRVLFQTGRVLDQMSTRNKNGRTPLGLAYRSRDIETIVQFKDIISDLEMSEEVVDSLAELSLRERLRVENISKALRDSESDDEGM